MTGPNHKTVSELGKKCKVLSVLCKILPSVFFFDEKVNLQVTGPACPPSSTTTQSFMITNASNRENCLSYNFLSQEGLIHGVLGVIV